MTDGGSSRSGSIGSGYHYKPVMPKNSVKNVKSYPGFLRQSSQVIGLATGAPLEKITEMINPEAEVIPESCNSKNNVTGNLLFEVGATLSEMQQQHYVQMELPLVEEKSTSSKISS